MSFGDSRYHDDMTVILISTLFHTLARIKAFSNVTIFLFHHHHRRYLREAVMLALSGKSLPGGTVEKALISNFELLNLVPTYNKVDEKSQQQQQQPQQQTSLESTKWRRVGLVLGRKVHLDTIVW
jgi:hypothetical protein